MNSRAIGLALGFVADRVLGDPQRFHPVAGFGRVAGAAERHWYADTRKAGVVHTSVLVGGAAALGWTAQWIGRQGVGGQQLGRPSGQVVTTALATWAVLGGRSLEREALAVHGYLHAGDLPAARHHLTRLVGRDTAELDASEVSRAVVESLAENSSDAVVAPLVWGAVLGIPGLLAYRAANTLDAMVGHHNVRYENFGWASARLDDAMNLPGSRLAGLMTLVTRPSGARAARRVWRRDASDHPSPNGGVVESAFAGSLGIRLGGVNRYYGDRIEHRAVMGDGRPAQPSDIVLAAKLARRVEYGAAAVCALAAATLRK